MRLSPPIAVLIILAASLIASTFASRITDCAYTPDGAMRWDATSEWFTDPGYEKNRYRIMPNCDVWTGIFPKKPLGTIELQWKTDANGAVLGRLEPDGSGFVAVFPADAFIEYGTLSGEDDDFFELEEIQTVGRVFQTSPDDVEAIQSIRESLAPMRDFQGNPENRLGEIGQELQTILGLDDPKTRRFSCRRPVTIDHWSGLFLTYGSEPTGGKPRVVTNHDCVDAAFAAMHSRQKAAIDRLVSITRSKEYIEQEVREKYPHCTNDWKRCFPSIF